MPNPPATAGLPGAVAEQLSDYLAGRVAEAAAVGPAAEEAARLVSDFVLGGGKRLRPLFAWVAYAGLAPAAPEAAHRAALKAVSALELLQGCALIHDDVIDASDTRRGRPTVHRLAEARHREADWLGDAADYGRSVAILAGDFSLIWADDLVTEAGLEPAALARAFGPWRAMRAEVIGGQLLDLGLENSGDESLEAALTVNRFKTAAYTVERPLHLGAAIAGAGEETIARLRRYGRDVGIAFQLRDDLLDVFGDPAATGKQTGSDLREGKRTALVAEALRLLDASDQAAAAELRAGLGTVSSPAEIDRLAGIIADSGAPADIERRIEELTDSGLDALRHDSVPAGLRGELERLAERATRRDR